MSMICSKCGSHNIGYDAWVDQDGHLIGGPYENTMCMDCESFNATVEERDI